MPKPTPTPITRLIALLELLIRDGLLTAPAWAQYQIKELINQIKHP